MYWNRRYEPFSRKRDSDVEKRLGEDGIDIRTFSGAYLHNPDAVKTGTGNPYQVFTPFWKNLRSSLQARHKLPVPEKMEAPDVWPMTYTLDDFDLTPVAQDGVEWAGGMRAFWTPGEKSAHDHLDAFVDEVLIDYAEKRNRPDLAGSSLLSPHLHFGELSPRQVRNKVENWEQNRSLRQAVDSYLSEIGWREFAMHVLWHFENLPEEPLKEKFRDFEWEENRGFLECWQKGETGYPVVDAGMRQLWSLGWMHNRVRMVAASFLTKHLLIHWKHGQAWFWDTLVDDDLANNAMNWQWVAGSGPDAQPFFRIFNPITQGKRHDPEGSYIRTWVPELKKLPVKYIHSPRTAPKDVLKEAGV